MHNNKKAYKDEIIVCSIMGRQTPLPPFDAIIPSLIITGPLGQNNDAT